MKTAFKLLLLSSSFLSANLFAESEWVSTTFQPGLSEFKQVISVTMSADGQIILITERDNAGAMFWRSTNGGRSWSILTHKK